MNYLKKQIEAIFDSKLLKKYGFMLVLTHIVILVSWWGGFSQKVFKDEAICWAHFQNCKPLRSFFASNINWYFSVYIGLIIFALWTWFKNKKTEFYFSVWALLILKTLVVLSDYRYSGNFNYFVFIINIVYLLSPLKKIAIPYTLLMFYFFAGLLKFNKEWISGSVFTESSLFSPKVLELLQAYVIILEMYFVFYLVSSQKLMKHLVLLQLFLFHAYSWYFVGFLYPLTMGCLISYFILSDQTEMQEEQKNLVARFSDFSFSTWRKSEYILLLGFILFATLQILPRLNSRDSALTGEGRYFSVTMFDSRSICINKSMIEGFNRIEEASTEFDTKAELRLHCDPLLYVQHFKKLCEQHSSLKNHQNKLNVSLFSKRTSDEKMTQILDIKDFCAKEIELNIMGYNQWISSNVL